jgi:hypothetical protein
MGSCTRVAPRPEGERGPKARLLEGSSASPAARGKKGESGGGAHQLGSLAKDLTRWRVGAGGSVPCRARGSAVVVVRGAGLGKLQCGDGLLLLALLFSSTSSLFPSPGAVAAEKGENREVARVSSGGRGGFIGQR